MSDARSYGMDTAYGEHVQLNGDHAYNNPDFAADGRGKTTPRLPRRDEKILGLPYKLAQHQRGWIIWLVFFNFDACILPIVLFYTLWFHTGLSHWSDFAVITALCFWTSYHKWFSRGWRIFIMKDPKYRPINGGRWWFDCSYYVLSLALLVMIIELFVATATKDVKVQVISMVPVSTLYVIGLYMLVQNTMHVLHVRTPVTLSSIKRGSLTPPPLFTVMEDVFAVDGCHLGLPAREAMLDLYQSSARYRKVAALWSWIWGGSSMLVAIVLSIIVGVTSETTSFGICYAISFPFITLMTLLTARTMEKLDTSGAFNVRY